MTEHINHPDHYGGDTVYEVIKVLEAWLTSEQFIGFLRGNAIKYEARAGKKGNSLDCERDLAKAKWYIDYEKDFRRRLESGEVRSPVEERPKVVA